MNPTTTPKMMAPTMFMIVSFRHGMSTLSYIVGAVPVLRHDRKALERLLQFGLGQLPVDHLAGQVAGVGRQVEVGVPAERREDHLLLAGFLAPQGFPHAFGERVGRL